MVEAQRPDFDSFPSRIKWNVQGFVAVAQDLCLLVFISLFTDSSNITLIKRQFTKNGSK